MTGGFRKVLRICMMDRLGLHCMASEWLDLSVALLVVQGASRVETGIFIAKLI